MIGTIVCDLDGVVYLGEEPVPGTGGALHHLARDGYRLLFCTNNSWLPPAEVAAKIGRLTGYPAVSEQVLSSASAAVGLLAGSERVLVLGGEGVRQALAAAGVDQVSHWSEADTVMVGLDQDLTYRKLAEACLAVRAGARLIATNLDATFPTPEGLLPGAGSIVAAVETATGRRAEPAGKPYPPMGRLIRSQTGDGPVWVVGDRPDTDLEMAAAEGWSSVLVLTGVVTDPTGVTPTPDLVCRSLADLPTALAARAQPAQD